VLEEPKLEALGRNPSITAAPPGGAPAFRSKLGFPLVPAET
jgi:hypothetical protein